jgi:peptidoglycan/LPS O-acetylase OafA/YrhL
MPPNAKAKGYYAPLTGVRAIAAYLVFFHHFNPVINTKSFSHHFFEQGYIGVTVFYVLSGLLICHRYYNKIEMTREWAASYWRNRIARIYPVYFILTVITLLFMEFAPELHVGIDPNQWHTYTLIQKGIVSFLNISMLKGFSESFKFTGIGQGWSLTVEMTFYLAAPILFLALHRSKVWFAAAVAAIIAIGLLLTYIFSEHYFYGFFGSFDFLFNYTFFGRCIEFLMGIGLGLVIKRLPVTAHTPVKPVFTTIGLLWIVGVMAILAFYDIEFRTPLGIVINNLIIPVGVGALLFGLMREQGVVNTLLSTTIFDKLGKASYAFYLIHMGVASAILTRIFHLPLLAQFVVLNLLAMAVYRFVEKPMHKLVRAKKASPTGVRTPAHS